MAAKQLFRGKDDSDKSPMPTYTEEGNIVFPSQLSLHKKLTHVIRDVFHASECEIRPHFHLTGESGSGKTFLVKMVCDELRIPVIEVNAAGLTTEGISGNSLSKALRKLREVWDKPNVILVDEFDKTVQRNGESSEIHRSGVQDEFLTALESDHTSVFTDYGKYEPVLIRNSLFIFAGAYSNQKIETLQQLKETGLRTEFVGRVPLVFMSERVTLAELEAAIPTIALFVKYRKLFNKTKVTQDVGAIIKMLKIQDREMNIGIRLLNSVIHQYFMRDV